MDWTYYSGLVCFDTKTKSFTHYLYDPEDKDGIQEPVINAVFADSRSDIWVGYGSKGLSRLNQETGEFVHYRFSEDVPGSIEGNGIWLIEEDSRGNIWVGTGMEGSTGG